MSNKYIEKDFAEVFFDLKSFNSLQKIIVFEGIYGVSNMGLSGLLWLKSNMAFLKSKEFYRNFISLVETAAYGVESGYYVELRFVGLGYRFLLLGNYLLLKVGFSHYIRIRVPSSLVICGSKKRLLIFGLSKQEVYNFVSVIRSFKRPDIYKGKGILLLNEKLTLKEGKKQQ